MRIQRDFYLKQLIDGMQNGMIKIVTGLRRSGKSFLLFELFNEYLKNEDVPESHIIKVALDDRKSAELRDPDKMLAYIDGKMRDDGLHYIVLDEVQMMDEFVDVLNSLLHVKNADVYVTGSNSKFLSKDVATEFRGRGDEIHLYPLSFAEYYGALGGDKRARWREYYTYGGIPQHLAHENAKKKEGFLSSLFQSVYMKDVFERHRIRNKAEFGELMAVVASSIGSLCNPGKLSNTFASKKGVKIDHKTISKYLEYMEDAFVIERAKCYDVKGKRYINSLSKFYFQDVGMVEARTTNRQNETMRKQLEVDFVANLGYDRYYIQSAFSLPDREKKEQEVASFGQINDAFKKIVIVGDDITPYRDEAGYLIIGLYDFLLDKTSLERL